MLSGAKSSEALLAPRAVRHVSELLERGQLNRKIGETMMNADSSRSHSVFTCILECKTTDESGITHLLSSRLNLVDLAGVLTAILETSHLHILNPVCSFGGARQFQPKCSNQSALTKYPGLASGDL